MKTGNADFKIAIGNYCNESLNILLLKKEENKQPQPFFVHHVIIEGYENNCKKVTKKMSEKFIKVLEMQKEVVTNTFSRKLQETSLNF